MAKTKKISISKKAKNKKLKQAKKQPAISSVNDKFKKSSQAKSGKNLKATKSLNKPRLVVETNFIKIASNHPELKPLINILPKLGMTLENFLDAIKLEKFLTSNLNPKGTIFEVLLLNDEVVVNLLTQRALGSLKDISIKDDAELAKLILNIQKKKLVRSDFDIADFNLRKSDIQNQLNLESVSLATNFNTLHENKAKEIYPLMFSDLAMVKFNSKLKKLLIVIPGEIKEPSAAKELADQLAQIERRLFEAKEVSFDIGKQKDLRVKPEDVFVVRDNAIGIPRRKIDTNNPNLGKDVKISSNVLDIVQVNSRDTKSKTDPQELFRYLVKVKPEYDPERILKALLEIKTKHLKIPHK